tara:strand:+ start:2788 stop:2934 length:147 start_codon:yes stop_codon:yes gene_type:complete
MLIAFDIFNPLLSASVIYLIFQYFTYIFTHLYKFLSVRTQNLYIHLAF